VTDKNIMLIEDDAVVAMIIDDALAEHGYRITHCADGMEGWNRLSQADSAFETILLDRNLPGLDGLEVLRRIKADARLAEIPVIMETASTDSDSIQEGINEGAYYYLTKPFKPGVLIAIVAAARQQYLEHLALQENARRAERPFALLDEGVFHYRGIDEARMLANFLAQACPDPGKVVIGLQELLVNAVEHGNLGISYAEKSALLLDGDWMAEVSRRLALPEQQSRRVEVAFERHPEHIAYTIRDRGEGFDWRKYLDFDPARIFDPHGRGIAMARQISFDKIEYSGNGNTVRACVRLVPDQA